MPKKIDNEYEDFEETADDLKIDQVPKTYILNKNWEDELEKYLPRNKNTLMRYIGMYRNKYIDLLVTPYPVDYPVWTPKCNDILYEVCGIDQKAFLQDVLTIRGWEGYEDKYLADKAPYILSLMIAKWFMKHGYKKELAVFEHYMGYSYYWAVFTAQFKFKNGYKPDLSIMKAAIEQMSYKSKLKALGSVDDWLYDGIVNALDTYKVRLNRGSDYEYHYIQEKIRGKFKSAMKTLYRAYDYARVNKLSVKTSYVLTDEEGNQMENTYGVAEIGSVAEAHTTKFFSNPINEKALQGALLPNGITEKDLRNCILMLADNSDNYNDVNKFYQSLFITFLDNGRFKIRDIGTTRFFVEMDKLYKPGNTNDPNKLFIKDCLDKWLAAGSKTFRSTNRTATVTTFRRSIFNYFVLKIMADT